MRFKTSIIAGISLGLIALYACSGTQRKPASLSSTQADQQAAFAYDLGVKEFEIYREERIKTISHPEVHGPKLLTHGHPTEYVVVFTHGLFESPRFNESIVKAFYSRGINIVMPTLPGHWADPKELMNKTKPEDLIAESERVFEIARKLGKNVILAGYSLGGLMSVRGALSHPEEVKGLLVWAPAIGITKLAHTAKELGYFFRFSFPSVSGNDFIRMDADGLNVPYLSSNAPILVNNSILQMFKEFGPQMSNHVFSHEPFFVDRHVKTYEKIHMPTFMVYSTKDELVNYAELNKFYSSISGEKDRIVYNDKRHNAIPKGSQDVRNFYNSDLYNNESDEMIARMHAFMDKYFPMSNEAKADGQQEFKFD